MEKKLSVAEKVHLAYTGFDTFATKLGISNMCFDNCHACCKDYFYIFENEFLYIMHFIYENHLDLSRYVGSSRFYTNDFRLKHANEFNHLEIYMQTEEQILHENDRRNYDDLLPCIFLEEGKGCAIYPARPCVCRWYGTCAPCRLIDNPNIGKKAAQEMSDHVCITYSQKRKVAIESRPYPIFYWFYKFLSPEYKRTTLKKLTLFSCANEEAFAEFKLQCQHI